MDPGVRGGMWLSEPWQQLQILFYSCVMPRFGVSSWFWGVAEEAIGVHCCRVRWSVCWVGLPEYWGVLFWPGRCPEGWGCMHMQDLQL